MADNPSERGERFLAAFRSIEHALRSALSVGRETPFGDVVRRSRSTNRLVDRYADDLFEFADLRNAISHRRNDTLLAEPTEEATKQLEQLRDTLLDPPRLDRTVGTRTVVTYAPSRSVRDAAMAMRTGDFSQLPIYDDGQFVALLTSETVARWVAAELERHDGILEDALVEAALGHVEDPDNCAFLSRSATVFEALDAFDSFSTRGKSLDAILVTHDGRPTVPLNIVTTFDIPMLLRNVPGGPGRLVG